MELAPPRHVLHDRAEELGARPSRLAEAWRQLAHNRLALVGSLASLGFILLALLAPWLAPYDYARQVLQDALLPPGAPGHLLGTDQLGRDLLSRLLMAIRVSIVIGLGTTAISIVVGLVAGTLAGYYGGWADALIGGITEITYGFPLILIAVIVAAAVGYGLLAVVIAVSLVNWAGFARVVRGEVLALRQREFVEAARALGVGDLEIMARHLVPNLLAPVLVMGSYYVAVAIIAEAGLSFIGLGAQTPLPSLGNMIGEGRNFMLKSHWVTTVPGLTFVALVLAMSLLGDGLRDVLDPRLKDEG